MKKDLFKIPVFSAVILRRDQQVCLLKRASSSVSGGVYAFAGGSVDGSETVMQSTIREAQEELGVDIAAADLKLVHVMHVKMGEGQEYINFFFQATTWSGQPTVMEPHKCDDIAWFDLDKLSANTMATHKQVVEMIKQGVLYSDFGF